MAVISFLHQLFERGFRHAKHDAPLFQKPLTQRIDDLSADFRRVRLRKAVKDDDVVHTI